MYVGFESHPRQLIFSRKSDCLGCAVLFCLVCLFDLALRLSFFLLISHLKTCIYMYMYMYTCITRLRFERAFAPFK